MDKTITITRPDPETLVVSVAGEEIATATHDSVGWNGITLLHQAVVDLAIALGVPVED